MANTSSCSKMENKTCTIVFDDGLLLMLESDLCSQEVQCMFSSLLKFKITYLNLVYFFEFDW